MVVLYIYLGSIAYALVVNTVYSKAAANYMKRHGYEFVKQKTSFSEKLTGYISTLVTASIPVFNLIIPTVMVFSGPKGIAEKTIPSLLKSGSIRRVIIPSEEANTENMETFEATKDWAGTEEKVYTNEDGFKVTIVELSSEQNEDKGPSRSRSRFNKTNN